MLARSLADKKAILCYTKTIASSGHIPTTLQTVPNWVTLHHPHRLTWLQNFQQPEGQLPRWLEKLQEFQFTIVHCPGKPYDNADALSQRYCKKECPDAYGNTKIVATTTLTGYSTAELCQAQLEDSNIGEVLQAKQGNCRPNLEHAKSHNLE